MEIQQQQPVNNLIGNKSQCKPKTQVNTQTENLVAAQEPSTTRQDIKKIHNCGEL